MERENYQIKSNYAVPGQNSTLHLLPHEERLAKEELFNLLDHYYGTIRTMFALEGKKDPDLDREPITLKEMIDTIFILEGLRPGRITNRNGLLTDQKRSTLTEIFEKIENNPNFITLEVLRKN